MLPCDRQAGQVCERQPEEDVVLMLCRHAGRSRVSYYGFGGHTMSYHAWKRGAQPVP